MNVSTVPQGCGTTASTEVVCRLVAADTADLLGEHDVADRLRAIASRWFEVEMLELNGCKS